MDEKDMQKRLAEATHRHHVNSVAELLKVNNVTVNDEELNILHRLSHQGRNVSAIIFSIRHGNSLLQTLANIILST